MAQVNTQLDERTVEKIIRNCEGLDRKISLAERINLAMLREFPSGFSNSNLRKQYFSAVFSRLNKNEKEINHEIKPVELKKEKFGSNYDIYLDPKRVEAEARQMARDRHDEDLPEEKDDDEEYKEQPPKDFGLKSEFRHEGRRL